VHVKKTMEFFFDLAIYFNGPILIVLLKPIYGKYEM